MTNLPQLFSYNEKPVRCIEDGENIWFAAKDVCKVLGIAWQGKKTLEAIPQEWQGVGKFPTPRNGGVQELISINEKAVYKFAFRSNKKEADNFTNWVCDEVLPAIRKTGSYQAEQATLIPSEQRTIQELMKQKHEQEGIAYPELYARFKNKFRVAKYDQLPREQFTDAVFYVSTMQNKTKQPEALPNANLAELRILVTHQLEFLAPNSPKRRMWQKMRSLIDGNNVPMLISQQGNQLALQV